MQRRLSGRDRGRIQRMVELSPTAAAARAPLGRGQQNNPNFVSWLNKEHLRLGIARGRGSPKLQTVGLGRAAPGPGVTVRDSTACPDRVHLPAPSTCQGSGGGLSGQRRDPEGEGEGRSQRLLLHPKPAGSARDHPSCSISPPTGRVPSRQRLALDGHSITAVIRFPQSQPCTAARFPLHRRRLSCQPPPGLPQQPTACSPSTQAPSLSSSRLALHQSRPPSSCL